MKTKTMFVHGAFAVLGTATVATSQTVIIDQIGNMDGSDIGANITASQDFEAAYDIYDIVTADNFNGTIENIAMVEMVLNGWNGFVDPSTITGYTANLYTDENAAAVSLTGDIASEYIDAADVSMSALWQGAGFLMSMNTSIISASGDQLIGVIPSNDFATGGQTGCADSNIGDGDYAWQANPGGGFGMPGNMQQLTNDAAYRVTSDSVADPCNAPLPEVCPADIDEDGVIGVTDVLAIIGSWGECGDGTYRPAGDIAPMPNGDCCVDVSDILAVVGAFGADCTIYGACCFSDGTCAEATAADCEAGGGSYYGDNNSCDDVACPGPYTGCPAGSDSDCDDCWVDGNDATQDCNSGLNGDGSMDPLTLGVSLCGEASVFLDISGSVYRDTDWFSCDDLNGGGDFTVTGESEGPELLFGIIDLDAVVFVEYVIVSPGTVVTYEYATLAPGNYGFWVGPSEWNTDWTCDNGANYWLRLEGEAATGACCVDGNCVGENTGSECGTLGGDWYVNDTCADINNCDPMIGACCMADMTCLDGLSDTDCVAFGGTFQGLDSLCSELECGFSCPEGSEADCDDCWNDGDDSSTDCNGGLNAPTPVYQAMTLGTPICGTASVFIDGPTGSTYRDIDWYDNATLNAGGDFTLSVGSSGMDLLFGIVDLNAGAFINAYICPGGEEMTQTETLPAGNYAYLCAPAEWNVAWTCSSGLVDYWAQLD